MAVRGTLSRERIVAAAAAVADRAGITAVSMRTVAAELGAEAMSLYHHVPNKEALLDELAEWVFTQIELPDLSAPWRDSMVRRSASARLVLRRHPWALGMLESRPVPGPALMRHHDRVLGCLFTAGFSAALATHAFSALDAYVYGFALAESGMPFAAGEGAEAAFAEEIAPSETEYPFLARSLAELFADGAYSFADEFTTGLDLILDGVERQLNSVTLRAQQDDAGRSLENAEDALLDAMRASDLSALSELISDDLRFTGSDGSPISKRADLEAHRTGATRFERIDVIRCSMTESGDRGVTKTTADAVVLAGSDRIEARLMWQRVWQIIDGRWRVVSGSVSALS